jgi:non-heme chloroperoxidase
LRPRTVASRSICAGTATPTSRGGDYNYDLFVRDLDVLITGLGLDAVTLVGWSMGGHIALKYAHEHPEKLSRVVITGSGPRFWQAEDAPYGTPASDVQGLIDAVKYARPETIAGLYANNFHRTDLVATKDWFVQIGWRVPGFVGLTSFQALIDNDLREILPLIDVPVHIFSGRYDLIWDPGWSREAHRLLPNSTLTFFENSGHVAFIENRIEWNTALVDILEGGAPAESVGAVVETVSLLEEVGAARSRGGPGTALGEGQPTRTLRLSQVSRSKTMVAWMRSPPPRPLLPEDAVVMVCRR